MTLDEAIFSELSSAPAVTAIAGDRSFPVQAQQSTQRPYIVWQTISAAQLNTHDKTAELEDVVVQFTCYADSYTAAYDLRRALRTTLEGETLGNGSTGYVTDRRESSETTDAGDVFRADLDMHFMAAP